jgi:hypothetical protein
MTPFTIALEAESLTPPVHTVVIHTANEKWSEVVEGAYRDGAWRFELDPGRHAGEVEFKFMLDGRWQTDPNLKVVVTDGGQESFSADQIAFQEFTVPQQAPAEEPERETRVADASPGTPSADAPASSSAEGAPGAAPVAGPSLNRLVNRAVLASIPALFTDGDCRLYNVLGFEHQGLWLQSDELNQRLLTEETRKCAAAAPAVFVPFAQIAAIVPAAPGAIPASSSPKKSAETAARRSTTVRSPTRSSRGKSQPSS